MGHRKPLMLRWFSSICVCWEARCKASSFPFSTCSDKALFYKGSIIHPCTCAEVDCALRQSAMHS